MTQERILQLAYNAQLEIWAKEKDILDKLPDNKISKYREQKAWNDLKEIEKMMKTA